MGLTPLLFIHYAQYTSDLFFAHSRLYARYFAVVGFDHALTAH